MKLKEPVNKNYAATVVELKTLLPLAGCDNVQAAVIFGSSVIVAKSAQVGQIGLFFPIETALSHEFLAANSLYRKAEYGNADPEASGFFEQHGRVRAMKFRGHKSEGFFVGLESLAYLGGATNEALKVGGVLDTIDGHEICRKYVPRGAAKPGQVTGERKDKGGQLKDMIVDGQFTLHFDTENLRRNADKILPTDVISVSDKWHGTSVVVGKPLVRRALSPLEHIARWLGVGVRGQEYGLVYSSRKIIKAVGGVEQTQHNSFYTDDIWGMVAREVEHLVPNGFTLYGEIVGHTPSGAPIQGRYAYGCSPGTHKFMVYRVTAKTPSGTQLELSWPQMLEFCSKCGLDHVPQLYYGVASALFADETYSPALSMNTSDQSASLAAWQSSFVKQLETLYVRDQDCPYNAKGVPAEGVVIRIDRLHQCESYKLKSFRFLETESKLLDKGEIDVETVQSEEVAV